jgi:hypothetical protein
MSKLSVALVLCLAVCPLLLVQAQGPAPELPAAPITPKVKTACMECHDSGIIVQQRLDKKTWGKEVDKMTKWGALVEKEDRDAFIDYLASNFGPDKPPAAPQYQAPGPGKPARPRKSNKGHSD